MMVPKCYDQYDDLNGQRMHMLLSITDVPSFVKTAVQKGLDAVPANSSLIFADAVRRKFPCHTKVATIVSTLFFLDELPNYSPTEAGFIKQRLEKAAERWDVINDFHNIVDDFIKKAETVVDPKYALTVSDGGKALNYFPINSAEEVVKSAHALIENRHKYPFDLRRLAARNIIKAAEEYVADLNHDDADYLEKAAGYGAALPYDVANGVAGRVRALGESHKEMQVELAKAAWEIKDLPSLSLPLLTKIARMLDEVDRTASFNTHYNAGLDSPEEICFGITYGLAKAAEDSRVKLTTGNLLKLSDLKRVPLEKLAAIMGVEFVKAVSRDDGSIDFAKIAEIAPTLPLDDAELLEQTLESAGVSL